MRTQEVIEGKKKMVSMNIDKNLYRRLKIYAAEKDATLTAAVEHLIRHESPKCNHDRAY